jgi:hypothetical protein
MAISTGKNFALFLPLTTWPLFIFAVLCLSS